MNMATEKILKLGMAGLLVLVICLLLSALIPVTSYKTVKCKGTTTGGSDKRPAAARADIDIESLSGKFFSSVSY
jgi:hypothetical protein